MTPHQIRYTPAAAESIRHLPPPIKPAIRQAIRELARDPLRGHPPRARAGRVPCPAGFSLPCDLPDPGASHRDPSRRTPPGHLRGLPPALGSNPAGLTRAPAGVRVPSQAFPFGPQGAGRAGRPISEDGGRAAKRCRKWYRTPFCRGAERSRAGSADMVPDTITLRSRTGRSGSGRAVGGWSGACGVVTLHPPGWARES